MSTAAKIATIRAIAAKLSASKPAKPKNRLQSKALKNTIALALIHKAPRCVLSSVG